MKFSENEKRIFKYLTTEDVTNKSATEIAKTLFVSRASIYRLCNKMGYASFSQFKYLYLQETAQLKNVDSLAVFDFVNDSQMPEMLRQFMAAEQIYVFGTHATTTVSGYFVRQLVNLGYRSIHISDSFELDAWSKLFTNRDCMLCFSNSGRFLPDDLACLQALPTQIMSITKQDSPLAKISDYAVVFDFPVDKYAAAFKRENMFNLMVITEKFLVNLNEQ